MNVRLLPALALCLACGCVVAPDEPVECRNDAECPEAACGVAGCSCSSGSCVPRCGNGRVDATEDCDPSAAPGRCNDDCTSTPLCGDGVEEAERGECEPPGTPRCSAGCRPIVCGDGRLEGPEACEPESGEPSCDASCNCAALDVCAGERYAIALRSDGALVWFGADDPRLGAPPVPLGPGRPDLLSLQAPGATRLACTGDAPRVLALDEATGALQLFEPEAPTALLAPPERDPSDGTIPPAEGTRWSELAAGRNFFALRTADERVFLLATDASAPGAPLPRALTALTGRWRAIAAGHDHLLLLATDGTVWVLGASAGGALGLGGTMQVAVPTQLPSLSRCDRVSASRGTSFVRCEAPPAPCSDDPDASDALGPLPSCRSGWLSFGLVGFGVAGVSDLVADRVAPSCLAAGLPVLEGRCLPRPHPLAETGASFERFEGAFATAFAIGASGDLYALGQSYLDDNDLTRDLRGNTHGLPEAFGDSEWNQDQAKAVPLPRDGADLRRDARHVAVTEGWSAYLVFEDGHLAATGSSCAVPLGLGTVAGDPSGAACRASDGRCAAHAEMFTTLSLCAAEPVRYDASQLHCGLP